MIKIRTTQESVREATDMAEEMGRLRNSITSGQGNIAGFLGEVLTRKLLSAEQGNTYDYDLVLPDNSTIDVKTKRTTVEPKDYYDCSVAALNTKQKCDYYAFVRVRNDYKYAWFLGLIPKTDYFSKARLLKKGDTDGDNGFIVKSDCYNMSIADLWRNSQHDIHRH